MDASKKRAKLQSKQLKSDMMAFKSANPKCILQDFIRWYSPNDWIVDDDETDNDDEDDETDDEYDNDLIISSDSDIENVDKDIKNIKKQRKKTSKIKKKSQN